jgi:lauroyl/myristoyl acyltransferase
MALLRELRRTLVFGGLRAGMEFSRVVADPAPVEALRLAALAAARVTFPLRMRLATNMRLAGVYRPGLVSDHFARAIDHMAMLAHVFRAGVPRSGCLERFRFDGSLRLLAQAHAAGKGVINIAPHLCGFPVYPPVVTPRVPCSIYLRHNKDRRKMRITEAVGLAGKGHLVYPPKGARPARRLQVGIDVLREGRTLFITPDTPRKPHQGVPVTVFGRRVHFPTGVFVMSMRTGAPVVPTVWHWEDGAYHVRYEEPIEPARRGRLKRQAEAAMQDWARRIDAFLHDHPDMWWNWLDKRWTRVLRNQ